MVSLGTMKICINQLEYCFSMCVFRAECGQAMCAVSEGGLSVPHGADSSTGQCGVGTERAEGRVLQRGSQQLLCRGGAVEV